MTILNEPLLKSTIVLSRKSHSIRQCGRHFHWYAIDYCEVFAAHRVLEQIDPKCSFAMDIICGSDLSDPEVFVPLWRVHFQE